LVAKEKNFRTSFNKLASSKFDAVLVERKAKNYADLYSLMKRKSLDITILMKIYKKESVFEVDAIDVALKLLWSRELLHNEEMARFFEKEALKLESRIFEK